MAETTLKSPAPRRGTKSAAAFRTISEVAFELDVPQHVLRFWETKFPQIRPLKRGGGRRYYRPEDLLLLRRIRDLDGYFECQGAVVQEGALGTLDPVVGSRDEGQVSNDLGAAADAD